MKILIVTVLVLTLLVSIPCVSYAALSTEEEAIIQKHIEVEKLKRQLQNLINERGTLLDTEKAKYDEAIQQIYDTYQTPMNDIESQIEQGQTEYEMLLQPIVSEEPVTVKE